MRTRVCLYVLLLLPLIAYWQTIFCDYGLGDDYSFLREAHEETGRLVKFTASTGRPLNGALLESSYATVGHVDQLPWMRLASALLLTALGVVLWRQLYQSGWNEVEAAAIGLGVVLLPSAQVVVGSAACWPQALTLLLAMAGFSAIETEIERGGLKRLIALAGGCMIYTAAGLIYQSNVLFALVPLTAVYLVRTGREPLSDLKWGLIHLATLVTGLLLGYLLMQSLFSDGVFEASTRMHFETNPFSKLLWFFKYPLPNSLALFALADDFFDGWVIYGSVILVVVVLLGLAYRRSLKQTDPFARRRWLVCFCVLPFLMHAISLVAAERSVAYRTLFPLAGLVLVLVVHALHTLVEGSKIMARLYYPVLALAFLGIAYTANRNSYELLGVPQANEWEIMKNSALKANFSRALRVYVITPAVADRSTERIYHDEFGTVSSLDDVTAQEMFRAAVRQRYPAKLPTGSSYTVASGKTPPAAGAYDLVIDMRKLKSMQEL